MKTLLKNARILKRVEEEIFRGEILVDEDRIEYIGEKYEGKVDKEIDCEENLVMPGFKNMHAHSAMVFLRSFADDLSLQDWLFTKVFPYEEKLEPEDIYWLSQLGFLEYLTSGITEAFDMYFYPKEIKRAAEDFGFREKILLMPNTTDRTSSECIKLYRENKSDLVQYRIGLHAEYTASEEELDETKKVIEELKVPFFTHLAETKTEVEGCKERRGGKTLAEFFESRGFFEYGGGAFHCCYMTKKDLEIFKRRGVSVITCPSSNLKLASGIAEIEKMREMGINLAIGTDGAASNNCLDMFREMFLATGLQKVLRKDSAVMPAEEILKMVTSGGARAVYGEETGVLEKGKKADLIMIDLGRPNMKPEHNIVKNLVYAGSKENVKMTMINGKILYFNGEFKTGNSAERIFSECEKITRRIVGE